MALVVMGPLSVVALILSHLMLYIKEPPATELP